MDGKRKMKAIHDRAKCEAGVKMEGTRPDARPPVSNLLFYLP